MNTNLRLVLEALEKQNVKVSPTKCICGRSEVEHFGYNINEKGYKLDEARIGAIFKKIPNL